MKAKLSSTAIHTAVISGVYRYERVDIMGVFRINKSNRSRSREIC